MKILRKKMFFLSVIIIVTNVLKSSAQDNNINVSQDSKFEKLLNEKRKLFAAGVTNNTFKIQIFNGSTDEARKTLNNFRREFPNTEATVVFNTPNYKVVAGNFKTRIAAEHDLLEVKKIYKNALLIRPRQ